MENRITTWRTAKRTPQRAIPTPRAWSQSLERKQNTKMSFRRWIALSGFVALACSAQGQDYRYYTNDGTVTIMRYVGRGGDAAIPDAIDGLPVTTIAFLGPASLTSLRVPNTVTNIQLPDYYLFDSCPLLTAIHIDPLNPAYSSRDGVLFDKSQNTLLKYPLARAGSYTIPESVSRVAWGAFSGCTRLTSITIPWTLSVSNTEPLACPSLTAIQVHPLHTEWSSVDGILFNKHQTALLRYPAARVGSYTVPDSVNRIESGAFLGCTLLSSITIPSSVASIGESAFNGCTGLSGITLPDGLIRIEGGAFFGCTLLSSITIPSSVTSIGEVAFHSCAELSGIRLPDGLIRLESGMFAGCRNLTRVPIPSGVTNIGSTAFSGCTSLVEIIIPDTVRSIWPGAFSDCRSLISISLPTGLTHLEPGLFEGCTSLSSVSIPDTVTTIGGEVVGECARGRFILEEGAFVNCTSLTNIVLPESVTDIGPHAFYGCTGLTRLVIPDTVTNIARAFSDCGGLQEITVGAQNLCCSSVDGVLFDKSQTTLLQYPGGRLGRYAVPNGVAHIAAEAFYGCTGLVDLSLPNSVTNIGEAAFCGCANLTNIVLGESVTILTQRIFKGCNRLMSLTIPDSVTDIDWEAFSDCARLTSVRLGSGVNYIEYPLFSGCTSLTNIDVNPANPLYSSRDGILFSKKQGLLIRYPPGKTGTLAIPGGVGGMERDAFSDSGGLTAFEVAPGHSSFSSVDGVLFGICCNGQTGLVRWPPGKVGHCTIPATLSYIDHDAFAAGCTGLTAFIVSPGNPNWSSVEGVLFDQSQTGIYRCPPVKASSYKLPHGVTWIEDGAFSGCTRLTDITLPPTLLDIWDDAFSNCPGLKAVYFEGNAPWLRYGGEGDQGPWGNYDPSPFIGTDHATVYYLPESAGWASSYGGRPTALWLPQSLSLDSSFGVRSNQFGFKISWARGKTVSVEAATNLSDPTWVPVNASTLTDGVFHFRDAEWTNYSARFYRVRVQ